MDPLDRRRADLVIAFQESAERNHSFSSIMDKVKGGNRESSRVEGLAV